ncbi:MAG: ABC transporter permease [Lachnospiraceae bacterium]|jgi:simple sugar transport system permease protein|nr:ABC transporter permease [Lachnospiraceae bacterium]
MKKLKESLSRDISMVILFGFFLAVCLLMIVSFGTSMFNGTTLASMGFQLSEVAVLAFGMALCMLLGGIDLSIVAIANLSSLVTAMVLTGQFFDVEKAGSFVTILIAVVVAITISVLCGLLNGVIISKFSVSPIVATLSTMTFYSGIAMGITGGNSIGGYPSAFIKFGNGMFAGIPIVFIVAVIVFVLLILALDHTKLGHEIHYIGENHTASRFTGIDNEKVIMKVYTLSGLMAGIASLIIMARSDSARCGYGDTYQLQVIMIAVLGGISPSGGKGRLYGVFIATFCMQLMQTAFTLWQFSPYSKKLIWGMMLLVIMLINMVQERVTQKAKIREMTLKRTQE